MIVSSQGVLEGRYHVVPRTLAFLRRRDDVLLLHRSADAAVFPSLYNGVGGHVEAGEDLSAAAAREVREETGLEVRDLQLAGVLHVSRPGARDGVVVFVFIGDADGDVATSTKEGAARWVPLADVDKLDVAPDLLAILPRLFMEGRCRPFLAYSVPGAEGAPQFDGP